ISKNNEQGLFRVSGDLPDDWSQQQKGEEECEHGAQSEKHSIDCHRPGMSGAIQQQGVTNAYRQAQQYVCRGRFKYYPLVFHPWSSILRVAFTNISYPQAFAMHSSVSGIEP